MTGDLAIAIPPIAEPGEETRGLDPTDADDRALLIAAAHPELDTDAETAPVEGPRDGAEAGSDHSRGHRVPDRR